MLNISIVWRIIIAVGSFAILIIIMNFISGPLFDESVDLLKDYSKDWYTTNFGSFMKRFTNIGAIAMVAIWSVYNMCSS